MEQRTLTLSQCKEYVRNIKDLELACYQLDRLHHGLTQRLRQAEKSCQRALAVKPESRPEKSGVAGNFFGSLIWAVFGAIIGAIAGVVIGFIRWLFSGEGFFHNFENGMDEPLKPYLINTSLTLGIIIAGIVFVFFFIVTLLGDKNLSNAVAAYEDKERKRLADIERSKQLLDQIGSDINSCEEKQEQTKTLLSRYYNMNYIYPKYRGIVPICTIYEYLESGRCFSLLGHEGAYNLYENELRMNMIIGKLDDIINRLDDISSTQRLLAQEIKRSNSVIDGICRSLDNIEKNTALTQYYSNITATNTSYLAWLAYIDR